MVNGGLKCGEINSKKQIITVIRVKYISYNSNNLALKSCRYI